MRTSFFNQLHEWANKIEWVVLLIVFALVLRLPSLIEPAWYGDETIYLAIGQELRAGDVLYQDITDFPNKPPLIYYFAALVKSVPVFRLLLLFWHIPAIIGFYVLTRQLFNNENISFFSTLAFVFVTNTPLLEGNIANAEMFFITPVIWGFYLAVRYLRKSNKAPLWHVGVSGLLLGVGLLFKFHVLFDALALLFVFISVTKQQSSRRWLSIAWLVGGLLVPTLLMFVVLLLGGLNFQQLIEAVMPTTSYVDSGVVNRLLTLPVRGLILAGLLLGLLVLRHRVSLVGLVVFAWFLLDMFAVLLSGRPYAHYLLQVIPAVILAVAVIVAETNKTEKGLAIVSLWIMFAVYYAFQFSTWPVREYYRNVIEYQLGMRPYQEYLAWFDLRMPRNYQAAEAIQANSSADDELFVWGTEPDLYVLTQKTTPARVVTSFHMQDLNVYQQTLERLQQSPPAMIAIEEQETREFPGFDQFVSSQYLHIETIRDPRGRVGSILLYRFVPPALLRGTL